MNKLIIALSMIGSLAMAAPALAHSPGGHGHHGAYSHHGGHHAAPRRHHHRPHYRGRHYRGHHYVTPRHVTPRHYRRHVRRDFHHWRPYLRRHHYSRFGSPYYHDGYYHVRAHNNAGHLVWLFVNAATGNFHRGHAHDHRCRH